MGGPLTDGGIKRRLLLPAADPKHLRIEPFVPEQLRAVSAGGAELPAVSYGLSGMGYDIRLGTAFRRMRRVGHKYPTPHYAPPLDPLDPRSVDEWFEPAAEYHHPVIMPDECVLAESLEVLRIPEDCTTLVLCKSTWARAFINLNTTPLEPGWTGTVTIEVKNLATCPVKLRTGEGIGQLVFFAAGECSQVPYNRRPGGGTYQGQRGPTPPKAGAPAHPGADRVEGFAKTHPST